MPLPRFLLLIFLICAGCSTPLPQGAENTLLQATIFRYSEARDTLLKARITLKEIDSLTTLLRKSHLKDANQAITMKSAGDTTWALGINPPEEFSLHQTYPLIIYLHGGINTAQLKKGARSFEMFDFLTDSLDCFIASPSGNRFARWWEPKGRERILLTVRYMTLLYPINPNRIILAGVSDGGTATFALAQLPAHPFTDFWAISGFPPLLNQMGIQLTPEELKKTPLYMINGGNDRLYPSENIAQFTQQLKELALPVTFSHYPTEEHGFDYKTDELQTLVSRIDTIGVSLGQEKLPITTAASYFSYCDTYHAIPPTKELP